MGSIVVYKRSLMANESEARYAGMIALGNMYKAKLQKHPGQPAPPFRKAVRETLWEIITDGRGDDGTEERVYEVRYEWTNTSGVERNWFIKEIDNTPKRKFEMYEFYRESATGSGIWGFENLKGHLVLNIEKDERLPSNVFTMSVNVPRRAELSPSWDYFDDFLTDLEAAFNNSSDPIENKRSYLTGALTFSRCR